MAPFRGLLESDEHYYRHAGRSLLAVVEEGDDSIDAYVAIGFVWIAFVLSFVSLFFFGYQYKIKSCGWEVIYVAFLEAVNYIFIVLWGTTGGFEWHVKTRGHDHKDGDTVVYVQFLRYGEWLITCPVILIALSNLTGLKDDYNWRTMKLLSADQGCLLFGATCAMTDTGVLKVIFFCIALGFGFVTFFTALEVYVESYANVPPVAKRTVAILTYMFFASWGSFPALFLMGPEGFGHMNQNWSTIMHSIADLFSKNLWGLYGWYLRIQVRNYHREMWFKEQERLKKGEDEFEVEAERRPDVSAETVGQVMSGADENEDEVDPYYAEYRRQRRRNRGRSLSEPVPLSPLMQDKVPEGVILEPLRKGMVVGEVIVADHQGFAAGTLFAMKLQEMGGTVLQAISKEAIMKTLQDATMMGRKITAVFVLDGMVSAQEALQVTGMYKTPFVQFGMQSQPREMFGEAYLMTPQPGYPFDNNKLIELMNRLASPMPMANNPLGMNQMNMMQPMGAMTPPQQASPRMSMSQPQMGMGGMPQMGGMASPMQQMPQMGMGGMASPMQQMGGMQMQQMGGMPMGGSPQMGGMPMGGSPQMGGMPMGGMPPMPMTPTGAMPAMGQDGNQSMDSLMAEMNQLKQYLNSQQGGV